MLRTNQYVSYYYLRYRIHLVLAECQVSHRQGAGVAKVCHEREVLAVAGRSHVPQSIDRGHEELENKCPRCSLYTPIPSSSKLFHCNPLGGLHRQAYICKRIRETNIQYKRFAIAELVRKLIRLLHPPPPLDPYSPALMRPHRPSS